MNDVCLKGFNIMPSAPAWKQHTNVIDALKYRATSKDLDAKLKVALGASYSGPLAFQIKMELQRQDKISKRPIRVHEIIDKINTDVVILDDREHHLDPITKRFFMELYKGYGDRYTIGVEERVSAFIKKNRLNIIEAQANADMECFPIDISEQIYRKEERMHLGVRAEAYLITMDLDENTRPSPDYCHKNKIECVTQNVSINGLKMRSQTKGKVGQHYLIRYTGLEKDYVISQPYVRYELVKCDDKSTEDTENHEWFLKKCENRYHAEFNRFITVLIRGNRGRYKIDMATVERSVSNNMAEQFFTNRQTELVLFLNDKSSPIYAYGSYLSQVNFEFFDTNVGNGLSELIARDELVKHCQSEPIYWMVYKKNGASFFSAVMTGKGIEKEFFKRVITSNDARLFRVELTDCVHKKAYAEHALPKTKGVVRRVVDTYSQNAKDEVNALKKMLILSPLDKSQFESFLPVTNGSGLSESEKAFTSLSFRSTKFSSSIKFIKAASQELRKEDRFLFKTKAVIQSKTGDIEGVVSDISMSGVSITLLNDAEVIRTKTVNVSFPEIEPIDGAYPRSNYKVVGQRNGKLRLFSAPECKPNARLFWRPFLEMHFNNLTPLTEQMGPGGLDRALRNLYNASITNIKALVKVRQSKACVTHVNLSNEIQKHPMFTSANQGYEHCENSKAVMYHPALQSFLSSEIRKINKDRPFSNAIMCIGYKNTEEGIDVISTKLWRDECVAFHTAEGLDSMLTKRGIKTAWFQVSLTRKSRIYSRIYREEYEYVEAFAPHKAQGLSNLLRSTVGIMNLIPIDNWIRCWTTK